MTKSLAIVTGASSGIGREICVHLARAGYRIGIDHYRDEEGASETLQLVRQTGSDGWICDADVGSKEEVQKLLTMAAEDEADLRVFVNNAAIQTFASLIDLQEEEFDRTIRTNLKGTFLCSQAAAKQMLAHGKGGNIINIGSGANQVPFPDLVDYCCSKGGIEMLTKVSAVELGPSKIRVNCIAPGAIENERTRRESPGYAETWGKLAPLRRCGTQQDIAQTVCYLVSDAASFVTGQTLFVDGGLWTKNEWPYE